MSPVRRPVVLLTTVTQALQLLCGELPRHFVNRQAEPPIRARLAFQQAT